MGVLSNKRGFFWLLKIIAKAFNHHLKKLQKYFCGVDNAFAWKDFQNIATAYQNELVFWRSCLGRKKKCWLRRLPKAVIYFHLQKARRVSLNFCLFSRVRHSNEASLQHYLELTAHIQLNFYFKFWNGSTGCPRTAVEFNRGATWPALFIWSSMYRGVSLLPFCMVQIFHVF